MNNNRCHKVKIRASLKTDAMEGWGMISPNIINSNGFYKISYNGNHIVCYLRLIDPNFIDEYNAPARTIKINENEEESFFIINEYYRNKLRVETNAEYNLEFRKLSCLKKYFSFDFAHPNPYVRENAKITFVSFIIGIIALVLAVISLPKSCNKCSGKDNPINNNSINKDSLTTFPHLKDSLFVNSWNDYEGKIGKNDIQLSLFLFKNGQIKGNYCYKKHETKIQLIGQLSGDQIEITQMLNGKPNGYFNGRTFTDTLDRFEGSWMDSSKTKVFDFKLTLQSICGGTFDHRYSDFYGTDEDVENFMKHIVKSILTNDKEWIGNHIDYPLKTTLANKKTITIKNKQELINNFDQIFHKTFREKIKSFYTCNLFTNYQGVMLGNGQIWINNKPNSTDKKYDYDIIAINN